MTNFTEFKTIIGTSALICYIGAIIFNNAGLGSLALGLTIYTMFGG